jgi:hypothetical protein
MPDAPLIHQWRGFASRKRNAGQIAAASATAIEPHYRLFGAGGGLLMVFGDGK